MGQAAENAREHPEVWLQDFEDPEAKGMNRHKPSHLEGLRFPWQSALAGVEQEAPNDENHVVGDIATAFRQYWRATHDLDWMRSVGFAVIEGIAQYYASRVSVGDDGKYHTYGHMGPDEYHANVTDSAYGNAVGAAALMAAHDYAPLVGKAPNATFAKIARGIAIPYNSELDYHPEYNEVQFDARNKSGGQPLIKQADTVLMYYPLGNTINASESTRRNDVRTYASLQDPHGVAMTWGIQAIVSLDIGDLAEAARYFEEGYKVFARPPFYLWHEGNGTDGSASQGAPNLVTGAGGFLQSVWAGYGGVRFERDDALTIRSPRPLPNSTRLRLRGLHFLGARLDIVAAKGVWTVALSVNNGGDAPALELVMKDAPEGAAVSLTHTPLVRKEGQEGHVRKRTR